MNSIAEPARRAPAFSLPLRPLFTATILLGSFLLFLIQPMFGRQVLPILGGSPSVWNTAMLFYQVVLLLGYLYAHSMRRLSIGRQLLIHLALFVGAALTLPIAVSAALPGGAGLPPVVWLLGLLALSIGPVFFVASAQAPLMQSWFARSAHPDAANPYFLYAASNTGSFAALIAYPLLLEPTLTLGNQALFWSAGFVLLALLVAACGFAVRGEGAGAAPLAAPAVPISWAQRGRWTLLAFIASGLLLSTTTHLTTDIMAMPLLWVVPLAVYLLSFIIAFGARGPVATRLALRALPLALLVLGVWSCLRVNSLTGAWLALAGVLLLFIIAVAAHGTLAAEKPDAGGLTDFYLWISVGGALGGVFCALLAPLLFDWPYEHPLLLLVAAAVLPMPALLPSAATLWRRPASRWAVGITAAAVAVTIAPQLQAGMGVAPVAAQAGMVLLALGALAAAGQRALFAGIFAMLLLTLGGLEQLRISATPGDRARSFFGIYTVVHGEAGGYQYLMHGTTLHGVELMRPGASRQPMTYYAPDSGVGLGMRAMPSLYGPGARIAFVGLGAGTLACYARPGQTWTAYEIDPVVVRIARERFRYISQCRPDLRMIIGDARLTLARATPGGLDFLAVDAFSSDAIPLHLVTREAFCIYGRALQPDGVLMIHVTNRFLDLEPLVAAIGAAEGWTVRVRTYKPGPATGSRYYSESTWIVLTRTPAGMARFEAESPPGSWQMPETRPGFVAWTDDFASILPVLRLRH
jgi:hypothetical protein